MVLLSVFVHLSTGKPASHASIACDEIARHVDAYESDDDGPGAVLTTDSAGRMVFVIPDGMTLHCRAWKGAEQWAGELTQSTTVEMK